MQVLFVLATFTWIGINVFDASFSRTPCEKAISRLEQAKALELERFNQAKEDGYRFTNGALKPLTTAMQGRMYAQQDMVKACR